MLELAEFHIDTETLNKLISATSVTTVFNAIIDVEAVCGDYGMNKFALRSELKKRVYGEKKNPVPIKYQKIPHEIKRKDPPISLDIIDNYHPQAKILNVGKVKPTIKKQAGRKPQSVIQFTLDGKVMREFNSVAEVARFLNVTHSAVCVACRRGTKCAGYKWVYKNGNGN